MIKSKQNSKGQDLNSCESIAFKG